MAWQHPAQQQQRAGEARDPQAAPSRPPCPGQQRGLRVDVLCGRVVGVKRLFSPPMVSHSLVHVLGCGKPSRNETLERPQPIIRPPSPAMTLCPRPACPTPRGTAHGPPAAALTSTLSTPRRSIRPVARPNCRPRPAALALRNRTTTPRKRKSRDPTAREREREKKSRARFHPVPAAPAASALLAGFTASVACLMAPRHLHAVRPARHAASGSQRSRIAFQKVVR